MATLQIRYLIDWLLIIANFAFKCFLVSFEELSIYLLHPPLLVILFSIDFIQLLLFMFVERVLPFDLIEVRYLAQLKRLQVLLMPAVLLIAR